MNGYIEADRIWFTTEDAEDTEDKKDKEGKEKNFPHFFPKTLKQSVSENEWRCYLHYTLCVLCVLCGENYGETNPNKWGLTIVYICRYFAADKLTADEDKEYYDCPHAPNDRDSMGGRFPERLTESGRYRRSGSNRYSEREP